MLGTRGVPATYSGFETCVEQLGSRLVQRGHQVTVYCRSHHTGKGPRNYRGMDLVHLPTIPGKYTDTIVHTFLSVVHLALRPSDIVLMFNVGNSPVAWIPRLLNQKVILNVDGFDWERDKWPVWAKAYIQFCARLATVFPDAIVADSRVIESYYLQQFGKESTLIAYGSEVRKAEPGRCLAQYGLVPREYVLFVGRLVPENCVHHLVEAFSGLDTSYRCMIVGDAPYAEDYIRWLKSIAGHNVIFTGYVFGEEYRELGSHAYAFVETSSVGGTHPALLEAMALGNCVIVNDTAANLEVIDDAGISYVGSEGSTGLRRVLAHLMERPQIAEDFRHRAEQRARDCYSWESVTDDYERLFQQILGLDMQGLGGDVLRAPPPSSS